MRAALYDRYGPAGEVLKVEEIEPPEPGPGEVRVRVAVSGINPTDWKSRPARRPVRSTDSRSRIMTARA